MDNKILVPLALLRAALIASKDEDEWDFRNLDAIAINKGHIVATDGCILFYAKLDNVEFACCMFASTIMMSVE